MSTLGLIIACVFFVTGLAGTVLPVLPGAPLIWVGMLIYGLFTGFQHLSWLFYVIQALAVLLTFFLDYAAGAWAVSRYGGSRFAVWGTIIGTVIGIIFFGPLGIIFGPLVGAVGGELIARRAPLMALKVGLGTLVGLIGGTILKLIVEMGMIVWFFMVIWR